MDSQPYINAGDSKANTAEGNVFDIAIVGGGMVGASLAVALQPLGLRIALIESIPPESAAQPSFDERTTALSNGSRQVLTGIGVWPELVAHATPIRRIHVSDQGRFGFARLDAREQGLPALGFVVPNRAFGSVLWSRLKEAKGFELLCPATVEAVEVDDGTKVGDGAEGSDGNSGTGMVRLRVQGKRQDMRRELTAKLLVAADGAQSAIRKALGIAASSQDYGQTAIVTTVGVDRPHDRIAYERFTPTGPIAILPLAGERCTVIWTLPPDDAQATLKLDDGAFLAALQGTFGFRLGRFTRVGRRFSYPLSLTQAQERIGRRCAIIGNAAQGLHPIAGQGFNLGLRDAATLAEVIAETIGGAKGIGGSEAIGGAETIGTAEAPRDIGGDAMLKRYDDWRRRDRRAIVAFTDGLVRLFGDRRAPVRALRNLGLLLFDLAPPAKTALSRLSSGFAGRLPRLARGAPLL